MLKINIEQMTEKLVLHITKAVLKISFKCPMNIDYSEILNY